MVLRPLDSNNVTTTEIFLPPQRFMTTGGDPKFRPPSRATGNQGFERRDLYLSWSRR